MPKKWRIHSHDPDRIRSLERSANVSAVVAQLLLCRGIDDPTQARDFLDARLSTLREPEELPGLTAAADRITAAVREGRRIAVYGDYDVDGMTAISTLWQALRLLGANVEYYVPHRMQEGYGLNSEALRSLAAGGVQQVITVDCGVSAVEEAITARELGLELIITDHHTFGDQLPDAAAIVHPRLPGVTPYFTELSGSGVAFKVAWAICQRAEGAKRVSERMKQFLLQAIALTAMGTVADVVPLVGENRILVRHGLASLKDRPTLGLEKLMTLCDLHKKSRLTSEDISFALAPRLNAAGRLGQAQLAVELLTTSSPERAQALAEYINELNGNRQTLERSVYLGALKQAQEKFDPENDPALVLADRGWHQGVIGIVAGRLAEKFHRPVILISLDDLGLKPGVGSARGIPGVNLHQALSACTQHLVSHGGHAAAAGLKIEEHNLDNFRADFNEAVSAETAGERPTPELWIDAEAPLSAFTPRVVEQMELLAPFGQGNTRPLVCATGVTLAELPKRIGGGGRHLSLSLKQHGVTMRAVAFGGGDWADELVAIDRPLSIAFQPIINEFRGRHNVEAQLSDWRFDES